MGIFRKYMTRTAEEEPEQRDSFAMSLAMFEFFMDVQDFKSEPDAKVLPEMAKKIFVNFVEEKGTMALSCFSAADREALATKLSNLLSSPVAEARKTFDAAQEAAVGAIEKQCFSGFLASEHFAYILELKAKEGVVPGLPDFRLIRVLGQGGFGQVLEVVKRDCGKHYAMKVMHKEMMRRCLGSSWRKKIALEKELMASLNHPFLVNLAYAFQNTEFLILVMDLVIAGDLSEFVLTKKRLTSDQTRFVIMETVCVMAYCHTQNVLYRDMKPENLLIDEHGHIRMIDMGLAARISKKQPKRRSRVGTDCYMAPEVRWCRRKREPYGVSCDWYTVGVLLYEFSNGALPFTQRDQEKPTYREGQWTSPQNKSLCESLLEQDWTKRIGSKNGAAEIKDHPFFKKVDWEMFPVGNGFRAIDQDKSEKDQAKGTLPEIDWDIVSQCKIPSPMKGVKGVPKKKKDKEVQAQRTAGHIAEAEKAAADADAQVVAEYDVTTWDYVSSKAITEEYMQSMFQCVSSI